VAPGEALQLVEFDWIGKFALDLGGEIGQAGPHERGRHLPPLHCHESDHSWGPLPLVSCGMTDRAPAAVDTDFREVVRWSTGGNRWLMALRSRPGKSVDRFLVRWVGWSLITWGYARAAGHRYQPTLLLQTIGARSGLIRTSVLPYYPVGDDVVVCGSNGGGPRDPMWVHNVRSDRHCWLRINRRLVAADARVAVGSERDRLFPVVSQLHPGLQRYQDQASSYGRDVPLVVLTGRRPPG